MRIPCLKVNVRKLKNFILQKIGNEIPDTLKYHGIHHTIEVYDTCNKYIKRLKLAPKEGYLLRSAALLHDIGIMWNYGNHEESGMEYARKILPDWGYSKNDIERICGMVAATRIPQQPQNLLEQIICDADLDYLGTDKLYSIGETLFEEFKIYGIVKDEESWDKLQINFLDAHRYHTDFAKRNREPVKREYLKILKSKWNID